MTSLRSAKVALSIVFALTLIAPAELAAQTILTTSATSGPWMSPGTWVGNAVPPVGTDVAIAAGHTVTLAIGDTPVVNSLTISGVLSAGAATLDVRGALVNNGQMTFTTGQLKLGGDYDSRGSGVEEPFLAGTGTFTLDGTGHQSFHANGIAFHNLTILNSFSAPEIYSGTVELWSTATVAGTLSLQGGILTVIGSINPTVDAVVQRTSGHIKGYLNMPVPVGQPVLFPVGTSEHYTPFTLTSGTAGSVTAIVGEDPLYEAGDSSLPMYWEIYSLNIAQVDQIVFSYDAALVRGDEASYVAGRHDFDTYVWSRYPTVIDTLSHNATVTGAIDPSGNWTLAEPWAVTTATEFSARIDSGAGNPRVNTPFAIILDAKDNGNPAVFGQGFTARVDLVTTTPAPTGTLSDKWGNIAPLYFYASEGEPSASLNAFYNKNESITLTVSDNGTTPRFTPFTFNLTVDPAAASLVVTSTAAEGDGSLPHALATANAGGCTSIPCPISFNIPEAQKSGDGVWRITMPPPSIPPTDGTFGGMASLSTGAEMVPLTSQVTIDATTQPGYTAGRPVVELDANGGPFGLKFHGVSSTVRGLAIVHGAGKGVVIAGGAVGVAVSGNSYRGGGLPISLSADPAALANDTGDADVNAVECVEGFPCVTGNNGQNTPEIISSSLVGTTLETVVKVDSQSVTSTQSIQVELYYRDGGGTAQSLSTACFDMNFVDNLKVFAPNAPVAPGTQVLATATSHTVIGCQPTNGQGLSAIGDGTSEFSAPLAVVACNAPVVTITPASSTLCANGSVVLSASVTGGTGTYSTYQWLNGTTPINGATSLTYTATAAGTYALSVTDSSGCVGSSTASVTQNPAVTVSIGSSGNTTFCEGGSVTLTAQPGGGSGTYATFQWYEGQTPISTATGTTLTVNTSGNYRVVVTDGAGCSAEAVQAVTVSPKPAASITADGPTTFCEGGSVVLTASSGATYQWFNNGSPITTGTNQTLTVTTSGSYSVTVTSGSNCSATSGAVSISVRPNPQVVITGPTSVCSGASVVLDAGPAFATYLWSNGATTQTISVTPTATTSYSVTVTNDGGCSATSAQHTVSVAASPTSAITGPASVCSGGSATLDAGAGFAAYLWSNGATTQTITVTPTATASYTVKVTASGGCSATSAPHTVSVLPSPTAAITGPTSTCSGASVTLDAGPGFTTYLWSNGATTQTISVTPTATTSYSVTVTNDGGCKATSPTHTVTVVSSPTLSIAGPASVCANAPFTLDAGSGFSTYRWSNGATTQTITVSQTQATTYSVEVTANGGCKASASKVVDVSPTPNAVISAPSPVNSSSSGNGASVPSQEGASYTWSIVNGSISSGQGTNAIIFATGNSGSVTISVTVTIGDCSDSQTASIATIDATADLSISMTSPAEVRGGDAFAYTINVRNDGPAGATDVVLTATVPSAVAITGVTSAWPCTTSLESVTCRATSAPLGAAATISIAVRAPSAAGPISASAAISSGSTDPNASNNSASASTVVLGGLLSCPTVAPTLVSPGENATGATSPVTFSWNAVEGATAYELWISSNGSQLLGTTTSTSLSAQVPSGTLSWFVVARTPNDCASLTSASRSLTVAAANNCPTTAPQITSPTAGSTVTSPVTVTWMSVPNASGYRVLARAAGDATATDLGTTTTALTLTAAVAPGSVELFVEAIFSGCPPARSAGLTFTVATPDPCADRTIATLTAPAQNATINSSLVRLEWSAATGADAYRIWVSVDNAAAQMIATTEGETFYQATFARGTILWWIEALYDGCASTESERRSFTIPPAESCGTALADPILPANNAVLPNRDVNFTWANVPSAVEYELWVAFGEGSPTLFGETDGATTNLTAPVPAGSMSWFVRARVDRCPPRDSASAAFTHQPPPVCTLNQRPLLVFPADGEKLTSPMNLRWSTPLGANRFEILVDRGNGPTVAASSTAGSADNVSLPTGRVKWFARAFYGDGCPPLDSAEQSILVLPQPATCSELAAPVISAPGQISSGVAFRIHWTPIPGATGYHLLASSRPDFGDAEQISVTAPDYQLTRENRSGGNAAVYARVRAIDSRCTTATFGPYGPTAAIFILPFGSSEAGRLASEGGIVESTITLPAELAGQSFTATPNATWLTVTPSSGVVATGGTTLTVTADTRGLALGTNLGGITITTVTASSGPMASHGTTIVTSPITVNLVTPVTQTPKSAPPPDALIIPAVAHADGVNAKFQSDVRITNSSAQLMKYLLTFTPTGEGIAAGRQTTMSVEPGRTVALDDVLKTWFGSGTTTSTVGTLEVRPMTQAFAATSSNAVKGLMNLATFASSRTFNMTAKGSFGQYIPAIPFANFIGKAAANASATVLSLQQIAQSDRFRTNLGLVEGSGNSVSLLVSVFSNAGTKLTSFVVDLKGGQHTQLNSFLKDRGITSLDDGRVEVAVLSGIGKVTAYASVLDNATSDPLLVTPVALADAGDTKWVLPGVADLNNGFANWQTDLRIFNGGTEEVETTVSLHSQNGGEPRTTTVKVPAGQVRQFDRALSSLFSISNDGGALHITTPAAARLVATARTYNQTSTGTYGQFISAVTASETAAVGTRPLQLLQIEESDRFRSNIGLAEVSGKPVKVSISVIPADSKVTAFLTVELKANEFRQINSLLKTVGMTNTHNARVTVRAIEGSGRVAAYASVIDLQTQDPTYIPAQ